MGEPEEILERDELADVAGKVLNELRAPVANAESLVVPHLTPEEREARDAARRARDEAVLREDAEKRRTAWLTERLAVLPPQLRKVVAGPIELTTAVQAAQGWARSDVRLLMLRGGIGVGKSVAAAYAVRTLVERAKLDASWHRPNDFVSGQLHDYDPKAPKIGRDLVVIDDMGRETKADFVEALTALLDDTDTRVIITTNMIEQEEFYARYEPRLMNRIEDIGQSITLKGGSRRKKGPGF